MNASEDRLRLVTRQALVEEGYVRYGRLLQMKHQY
jgi:hypothetical protein